MRVFTQIFVFSILFLSYSVLQATENKNKTADNNATPDGTLWTVSEKNECKKKQEDNADADYRSTASESKSSAKSKIEEDKSREVSAVSFNFLYYLLFNSNPKPTEYKEEMLLNYNSDNSSFNPDFY
ncbi:MAG: hypothetical protein LAT68_03950 [Cyclobacteriaceae bacterium]|nr:hypothetical protein [Cyclobacteriaceae bacterium]MCH8515461.1 hypothetical protein [Cyclobacteriaceae bacterium]